MLRNNLTALIKLNGFQGSNKLHKKIKHLKQTNCAVDAAISFEATTSSSNFPFRSTTLSAASL